MNSKNHPEYFLPEDHGPQVTDAQSKRVVGPPVNSTNTSTRDSLDAFDDSVHNNPISVVDNNVCLYNMCESDFLGFSNSEFDSFPYFPGRFS